MKLALSDSRIDEVVGEISPPPGLEKFGRTPAESVGDLMTVGIKLFFLAAGIVAFLYLLRGAVDWIMSSGEKEKIGAAQQRIQNAIIGLLLLFFVIGLIATLEQIVFAEKFCFGLTCPIKIPQVTR